MHVIHSPNHVFIMLQMGTSRKDRGQGEIEGQSFCMIRGARPAASPRTARERGTGKGKEKKPKKEVSQIEKL